MSLTEPIDDETPFVREECGDTMWDEDLLNSLTTAITPMVNQPNGTGEN